MLKRILLLISIASLFVACTGKNAKKQESAFIVMKTKSIKFADMGFIYDNPFGVKVEVYANGQPLVDLDINEENICFSLLECMEKNEFNKKVLVAEYPATLLENIFRAKPIFSKENFKKIEGGFEQNIKKDNLYDISYSVVSGQRVFRDRINKILIKVREQK